MALESFNQAQLLDPMWEAPKIKEQQLVKYLDSVNDLVNTTGKMKGKKRLHQILSSIDKKQLGPYSGGSYTSNDKTVQLTEKKLSELIVGINLETVILGKVVCSVHNDDSVPFTFCLVDKESTCVAVTVYNLAEGKGVIIGDSVAIPEPYVAEVKLHYNNKVSRLLQILFLLILFISNLLVNTYVIFEELKLKMQFLPKIKNIINGNTCLISVLMK